jgi:hypothetical protein
MKPDTDSKLANLELETVTLINLSLNICRGCTGASFWYMGFLEYFFCISKRLNLKYFKKITKKYLDEANCIHYLRAKFQYEIPYILFSAKRTKTKI